jgi:hypothetical protein
VETPNLIADPTPRPIADYLDVLTRELDFDRALSRRVRDEIADHLHESMAHDAAESDDEARARYAVERFGAPRELAAAFAATALARQAKTIGLLMMLVEVGIYVAMKGRVLWWGINPALHGSDLLAAFIMAARVVFWVAVVLGLAGWLASGRLGAAGLRGLAGRRWLKRCLVLCATVTGAVVVLVALDAALVSMRVLATAWSSALVVPLLFMAAELTLAAILAIHVVELAQRTASASSLLRS